MNLIKLNSKKGIVNLFADFLLQNIDKDLNTIIQITDLNNFFLVNGITESQTILDLSKIKDEFISKYQDLLTEVGYPDSINTMDLIKYGKSPSESENRYLWSTFYNSSRPIYHQDVIDVCGSDKEYYSISYNNGLVYELDYNTITTPSKFTTTPYQITSEFPYGYSLSMGRGLLYYSEYIANQIITPSMSNMVDILITNKTNEDGEQVFDIRFDSPISEETIKSMVLDIFDFDLVSFNKKLESYDLCDDIKKPTESKPWLVRDKDSKDLIVF
jgi:hypothetical protein